MSRSRAVGVVAPVVVAVTMLGGLAASEASAAVPDACGLTTELKIAKAFDFRSATEHGEVLAAPGNSSGVVRIGCRVFSWNGSKPSNNKRRRDALLEGRLAWLTVDTWVTDQSPHAPTWREHFDAELKAIRAASVQLFLRTLHGKTFVPPRFGADDAIAYEGSSAKTVRVRALWWKRSDKSLLEMNVEEARGKPATQSLRKLASVIAERFNTECVYPCEAPATG